MHSKMPAVEVNRLLIADTDADCRLLVCEIGMRLGYSVKQVADRHALIDAVSQYPPTVLVLDPANLGLTDTELRAAAEQQLNKSAIVVASARDVEGLAVAVSLRKPLLGAAIEAALAPQMISAHRFSEADLRRAIDRSQLLVHYQPKLKSTTQGWQLAGIAALLRWDHPEYGLVYPSEFIGLAEEYGLIGALTDFCLQTGIDEISEWNRRGIPLELSVNMSPALVSDNELPQRLTEFLLARGVDPRQLTLEITETAGIDNPARTVDVLARLRERHIGLALDDFGIGYSSLTQLYKLPFSEVKIDQTIGIDLAHTSATRTIVCSIIDLGHRLGLKVCCEGVENATVLEFLRGAGCDSVQGYHIARPMGAAALANWIRAKNPATEAGQRLAS